MNFKTFNLVDKINATGLDNTKWNIYIYTWMKQTRRNFTEQERATCSILDVGLALLRKRTVIFLSVTFASLIML